MLNKIVIWDIDSKLIVRFGLTLHLHNEFDLSSSVPTSIFICLVAARRLDVYEEECDTVGCSVTLRSRCSRKSLSCRSLSCNRSSVSLNTLGAEWDDVQLSSPTHARTSAFSSRVVRHFHTLFVSFPAALHPGKVIFRIRLVSLLFWDFFHKFCPGIVFSKWFNLCKGLISEVFLSPNEWWWINVLLLWPSRQRRCYQTLSCWGNWAGFGPLHWHQRMALVRPAWSSST